MSMIAAFQTTLLQLKQERLPIILVIVIVHTIILADNRTPINRSTIIF